MIDDKKKPGMAVMVAIGKPKPPDVKRLDQREEDDQPMREMRSMREKPHSEPDEDQRGGPSDDDADNRIGENLDLIQQHVPEAIHPIADLIEAIANYCRKARREEVNESETENYPA